jgi:hypothetical protein
MWKKRANLVLLAFCLNRTAQAGPVDVTVDSRVELITVVQLLSGYEVDSLPFPLLTQFDFKYRRTIEQRFAPYRNHAAVASFLDMARNGFNFAPPIETMLYLSDPPELKQHLPLTDFLIDRAGGAEHIMRFVDLLGDFARTSRFMEFFKNQSPYYGSLIERESGKSDLKRLTGRMEDYYGTRQAAYRVVLAQLIHAGGYGPRVRGADGRYTVYAVVGPKQLENDVPDFGSADQYRHIVLHEFSHSFVNPIVESNAENLKPSAPFFETIRRDMENQGCADWNACVAEQLVRAVSVRLTWIMLGPEAGADALNLEYMQGFRLVDAMAEKLKEYEDHRKKYRTLADFFPEIVRKLDALDGSSEQP